MDQLMALVGLRKIKASAVSVFKVWEGDRGGGSGGGWVGGGGCIAWDGW